MNILQVYFGSIFNSAGGAEKVFCNYSNLFTPKHNVLNLINDTKPGKIFFNASHMKIINLNINHTKYTIPLPFKVRLKHLFTHNFRKYIDPREEYFLQYFVDKINKKIKIEEMDLIICYSLLEYKVILKTNVDRKKIILMFHVSQIKKFISNLSSKELSSLKNIGAIQILLEEFREQFADLNLSNIHIIGNIVPSFKKRTDFSQKSIIIISRLNSYDKRPHLLIEAFAKISKKYPDWKVYIVGSNPKPPNYLEEMKTLIKNYDLQNQIYLLGLRKDIPQLLRQSSIFALTSKTEGFGLALTEAMSSGLAAIAFKDTPAMKSLIQHNENGLLANDLNDFTIQLEKLIQDEDLRIRLGSAAQQSMEQYSEKIILKEWDTLINSVYENSISK